MDDQNLTPVPIRFFVCGHVTKTWIVVEYSKVDNGWRSRVVYGKAPGLGNLYVSNETRDELAAWFVCDFSSRPRVFDTLDDAMEHIARKSDQPLFSS